MSGTVQVRHEQVEQAFADWSKGRCPWCGTSPKTFLRKHRTFACDSVDRITVVHKINDNGLEIVADWRAVSQSRYCRGRVDGMLEERERREVQ